MLKNFKKTILLSLFSLAVTSASYADTYWDYYGSGRDHPYSEYIDRANYIGPADYATIVPIYINGPLVITNVPPSPQATDQFTVNIPNVHGGYNAVVIKRSGDGFIGPNGEYYPEFPKIFQLQMKYGN